MLLHLMPEQAKVRAPEPLLRVFIMDNAWAAFNNMKEGIKEVSILFDNGTTYL